MGCMSPVDHYSSKLSCLYSSWRVTARNAPQAHPSRVLRPPQALGGQPGPFNQGRELGPHDTWVLALIQGPLGKAAVGSGDDPLPAHHPREIHEAFGHRFGMLDDGCRVGDDTGNEDLAFG